MEVKVSRKDLFGAPESPSEDEQLLDLDIQEINVEDHLEDVDQEEEQEVSGFQLFGGTSINIDLDAEPEEIVQERPQSYYFISLGADKENCLQVAVTGDQILAQAAQAAAAAALNPPAPDINAGWKPNKRSRPGKQARERKKVQKEILKKEKKELETQRMMRRRYGGGQGFRGRPGFGRR